MTQAARPRELVITRLIDAPPEKVFRAWTEAALMERWMAPKPWTLSEVRLDPRPGGVFAFTMHGPDGETLPNTGVFLEVTANEKIVTTDAYGPGWIPSDGAPFFTGVITFEAQGGKTLYTARARHWTDEACEQHKAMGFQEGWSQTAAQLEEVARTL